jgi:hypothetical protein
LISQQNILLILLLITIIHFGNNGLDNNKNNEDKSWKDIMCLTLVSFSFGNYMLTKNDPFIVFP